MEHQKYDFGMVGLGVMGRNFLLNVADHGYAVAGLDTDTEKARALEQEGTGKAIKGFDDTAAFVSQLKSPRIIMLLVPAGKVVDLVIEQIQPFLEEGDLIMDGGNSHFSDTDRRMEALQEKGISFLGVGVSGGAEGARRGPSIMPGGSHEAWQKVAPILEAVSAKVGHDPCVAFMGNGSAGHYVKMVHNGIEYAMMQLLAESYDLLKQIGGLSNSQLARTFQKWNQGQLRSFLVEITALIFKQDDDIRSGELIDKILDKAKQKGTGKWTSQDALNLGIPIPTIDAAVSMRQLSALKSEREEASRFLRISSQKPRTDQQMWINEVEKALCFGFMMSYAQGLNLLQAVSVERNYNLDMEAIGRIWRGGCIIRADLLEDIRKAYGQQADLPNLLLAPVFQKRFIDFQSSIRNVLRTAISAGISTLCLSTALAYFDAYRTARLPLNLVQAQRDFFGSHSYERTDREGSFRTDWNKG